MNKAMRAWPVLALAALVALPWWMQEGGLWSDWLALGPQALFGGFLRGEGAAAGSPLAGATALGLLLWHGPAALAALLVLPVVTLAGTVPALPRRVRGVLLLGSGAGALLVLGLGAWRPDLLGGATLPPHALGWGAMVYALAMLFVATTGAALLGACRGDVFVCGAIGLLAAMISLFVLWPVLRVLLSAFGDDTGYSLRAALPRVADARIWSLGCLAGDRRCGVAWNTLTLALMTGAGATLLGLAFALVVTRTGFRFKKALRALTVLPIITPPFVIGLALILLFGRNGAITQWVSGVMGLEPGRGLYGFVGVWIAQLLSFTPIAFMVLIGVVEGISPAMEEASQTLGASRWETFRRVSLPLMRPGLANAFLVAFIESMADFGNPMVLGGNYGVLSTEIYFAVVGAQNDAGRAAGLGLILLAFAVSAFVLQRRWVGRKSYATVTGKAENGQHAALDPRFARGLGVVVSAWTAFTVVLYGMILFGGFVHQWGRDHRFTLRHYIDAFGLDFSGPTLQWTGAAWSSLFESLWIAGVSAPLTAALGLLAAWLLVRQRFAGKGAFEFATMLSFAIPGTVIGISYILAFNVAPVELTGTGAILVLCFVFRNMPVGLRGGIAAMSQLDASLDEASTMLRANSFVTVRRVLLPLLRPALSAALVYSFVRSITSISAVVFLVSADHQMATAYIVGLVENGQYGVAIAYASVLIVVMLLCVVVAQALVGQRRLRRRDRVQGQVEAPAAAPLVLKEVH